MYTISHKDYLRCLEPWIKASEKYLYICTDRPELICYGTGFNGWGVQTNQKAFAAFAVAAADPAFKESKAGMSRDEVLYCAIKMLRFSLESHIEGSYHCLDGTSWGHTWISGLGIERMMHGVEAIYEHLTENDQQLLYKVLVSESNWLMDDYKIVAHPKNTSGQNKPESNLWNGALLHRTAAMFPNTPRVVEYIEKGTRFLVNSVSIPSDNYSKEVIDGKPVSDWYIGNNFFETYALNHHGYLNIGYMVICLSNAAMLHFMYRSKGITPPKALYHHLSDLWKLVKECTFPDGRLLRIGGDTRVRYCYCQDYAIPTWLLMIDHYGEIECEELELGWLQQVRQEMENNGDGTYLSDRCGELEIQSPNYYTRLEADRAVTLSMGAYWRRIIDGFSVPQENQDHNSEMKNTLSKESYFWYDGYHGACLHKSEKRIASWVWEAGESPQGLCLPPDASNLAEWRWNLAGQVKGIGTKNDYKVISHKEKVFSGGFLTSGLMEAYSERMISEQQTKDITALHRVVYAALPDDTTIVVIQHAVTPFRSYLTSVKGLLLHIPNDLFNGYKRTYYFADRKSEKKGLNNKEEIIDLNSKWINVDNRMGVIGVYGENDLTLYRPSRRQIGIKNVDNPDNTGMLYSDEICYPVHQGLRTVDANTALFDIGFIVQSGISHENTKSFANHNKAIKIETNNTNLRAIFIEGDDYKKYLLIANLKQDTEVFRIKLPTGRKIRNLDSNGILEKNMEGEFTGYIQYEDACLYVVES
jgi:hypothetical protein